MQPKVLVVDDDRHILGLLTQLFREEGFAVRAATDGVAALEVIEQGGADVIVSDIMMPRLDGIQLARQVQDRELGVPIVLISAIPRRLDMPNVPFLRKPFDLDQLLLIVHELLTKRSE